MPIVALPPGSNCFLLKHLSSASAVGRLLFCQNAYAKVEVLTSNKSDDMKLIPLTQGKFAKVDDADFEWLSQWKWTFDGKYAVRWPGTRQTKRKVYMHRLINQTPIGLDTDHEDRDPLNNQRYNLKAKSHAHNIFNRQPPVNKSSGHTGISWAKANHKWHVYIGSHPRKNIGLFTKLEDAIKARETAVKEYLCG